MGGENVGKEAVTAVAAEGVAVDTLDDATADELSENVGVATVVVAGCCGKAELT